MARSDFHFLRVGLLGLAWVLPFAVLHAQAPLPGTPPSVPILFVGNSFTHGKYLPVRHYNSDAVTDENLNLPESDPRGFHPENESGPTGGIPGIFKKLTDEAGLHYDVHLELVSARDLAFHYKHALSVIAQPKWSAVILQGYSTEPVPVERGGKPESFRTHAALLEKAVHAVNPNARLYLYETWPRADLTFPEKCPYQGQPIDVMAKDLHDGYERAFIDDGHFTGAAWAGDAWLDAIHSGLARGNPYRPVEQAGQIDLWGPDHYHPSVYGAYLSALVLFQEITGIHAGTLGSDEQAARDLGIPRDDATKLQAVAETAARASASAVETPR